MLVGPSPIRRHDGADSFKQLPLDNRRMLAGIRLVFVNDLADVLAVGDDVMDETARPPLAASMLIGFGGVLLG